MRHLFYKTPSDARQAAWFDFNQSACSGAITANAIIGCDQPSQICNRVKRKSSYFNLVTFHYTFLSLSLPCSRYQVWDWNGPWSWNLTFHWWYFWASHVESLLRTSSLRLRRIHPENKLKEHNTIYTSRYILVKYFYSEGPIYLQKQIFISLNMSHQYALFRYSNDYNLGFVF